MFLTQVNFLYNDSTKITDRKFKSKTHTFTFCRSGITFNALINVGIKNEWNDYNFNDTVYDETGNAVMQ